MRNVAFAMICLLCFGWLNATAEEEAPSSQATEEQHKSFLGDRLYAYVDARCDTHTQISREVCLEFSSALILDLLIDDVVFLEEEMQRCERERSLLNRERELRLCDQAHAIAMSAQGLQTQIRQMERCIEEAQIMLSYNSFEASLQLDECSALARKRY